MPSFTTTLAGANFRPSEAREVVKSLTIGELVELEADPDNQYDSCAVKVLANDQFIGFVAKVDNGPIFAALERDEELYAEIIGFESSLKPIIEITLP